MNSFIANLSRKIAALRIVAGRLPRPIVLVALAYILVPVLSVPGVYLFSRLPIVVPRAAAFDGTGIVGWSALWFLVTFGAPLVGIGIFFTRRWGYVLLFSHSALVVGMNCFLLYRFLFKTPVILAAPGVPEFLARNFGTLYALLFLLPNVLVALLLCYFLTNRVRVLFFSMLPRGLLPRRDYRSAAAIEIKIDEHHWVGRSFDLNRNGFFFRTSRMNGLKPGARGGCTVHFGGSEPVHFDILATNLQKKPDRFRPAGFGALFMNLTPEQKIFVRDGVQTQKVPRTDLRFPVEFKKNGQSEFRLGVTENLSINGFYIVVYDQEIAIGDQIEFELPVLVAGSEKRLTGSARIAWRNDVHRLGLRPGFGARFSAMQAEDREFIRSFLKQQGRSFAKTVRKLVPGHA